MLRVFISTFALAALTATAALAQSSAPVYCGSFTCFQIHATALGKDADTRANQAMDVINKYLGGAVGRVSVKPDGRNVRLLLNGDTVAVVTPADASAERQKSPVAVAQKWSSSLNRAFEQSKARK
jgi:hypothetical protein